MSDIEFLQMSVTKKLIELLMTERNLSFQKAFELLSNSNTFRLLMDKETALYRESPYYVNLYLEEELANRS